MSIRRNPAVGRHFGFDFLDVRLALGSVASAPALAFAGTLVAGSAASAFRSEAGIRQSGEGGVEKDARLQGETN